MQGEKRSNPCKLGLGLQVQTRGSSETRCRIVPELCSIWSEAPAAEKGANPEEAFLNRPVSRDEDEQRG